MIHDSVSEMLRGIGADESIINEFVGLSNEHQAGKLIFAARTAAGITQTQLASAAGCSQGYVSKLETHKEQPSLLDLLRLLDACGFDLQMTLVPRK